VDAVGEAVLIVGVSTRALVASALGAGWRVISLDYFADSDLPREARAYALGRDFGLPLNLKNLARAAETLAGQAAAVVYAGGVENEPRLARGLLGLQRLGNPPEAMRAARDPRHLAQALAGSGLRLPETIRRGEALPPFDPGEAPAWLVKRGDRAGGRGVSRWQGRPLPRRAVLQRCVSGDLYSAAFLADGRQARLLGLTRQYAGVSALGAQPFWWCGNVAPLLDPPLAAVLERAAQALTAAFGLVGLNGIDFIVDGETPYLLEVNPRCGGSVELFERVCGVNAFDLHVRACAGELPAALPAPRGPCWGKGILYAPRDLRAPDTRAWFAREIRDVPHPGEAIPAGAPICTVLASAPTPSACWQAVLTQARALLPELESPPSWETRIESRESRIESRE
jgi:predicted ATP-grasp superfamily ATP-dependent carboligase